MASPIALPATLPSAATMPATVKATLPALTVMFVNGAKDLVFAVLILIAGWSLARWFGRWMHDALTRSQHVDPTLKPLIAGFARYLILAITFVAVLGQFGVQTTSLIALLGAAGLAIGLALQGTLSNVASGVMLLFLRPFRVYDKIKVPDALGTVRQIGLFRTDIITDDGNYVSIPNATIFSGTIVNVSREQTRRTDFTIEIDRGEKLDQVQKAIEDALTRCPRVRKAPAPFIAVDTLGPISTTLKIHAWVDNHDFQQALSDVKKQVREALQSSEVTAPVPVPAPAVAPWTPPQDAAKPDAQPN